MSLFFRAAACATVLATTIVTMATGTQSMAAMLDSEPAPVVAAVDQPEVVAFVSRPVVQPVPEPAAPSNEPADAADEDFATLRDAVDSFQDDEALTAEERCMAIAVFYESKGEPLAGQMAVAHVILNRVESRRFPNSVCGVVTQRSQFSFVRGGRLPSARAGRQWETAKAVTHAAMADAWDSPVGEALFFHATRVSPRWNKTKVATLGNHVFYR